MTEVSGGICRSRWAYAGAKAWVILATEQIVATKWLIS